MTDHGTQKGTAIFTSYYRSAARDLPNHKRKSVARAPDRYYALHTDPTSSTPGDAVGVPSACLYGIGWQALPPVKVLPTSQEHYVHPWTDRSCFPRTEARCSCEPSEVSAMCWQKDETRYAVCTWCSGFREASLSQASLYMEIDDIVQRVDPETGEIMEYNW